MTSVSENPEQSSTPLLPHMPLLYIMGWLIEDRGPRLVLACPARQPQVPHPPAAGCRLPRRPAQTRGPRDLHPARGQLVTERAAFRAMLEQRRRHRHVMPAKIVSKPGSARIRSPRHPSLLLSPRLADTCRASSRQPRQLKAVSPGGEELGQQTDDLLFGALQDLGPRHGQVREREHHRSGLQRPDQPGPVRTPTAARPPEPRPRPRNPGRAAQQASGRTPAPRFTPENSSGRNQAGNELPELAGGSRHLGIVTVSSTNAIICKNEPEWYSISRNPFYGG